MEKNKTKPGLHLNSVAFAPEGWLGAEKCEQGHIVQLSFLLGTASLSLFLRVKYAQWLICFLLLLERTRPRGKVKQSQCLDSPHGAFFLNTLPKEKCAVVFLQSDHFDSV